MLYHEEIYIEFEAITVELSKFLRRPQIRKRMTPGINGDKGSFIGVLTLYGINRDFLNCCDYS